jgi:hypothetical protein
MVRKFMAASAALVLAGVMAASIVHAKACPALCKVQIKACKDAQCASLKGKEKGACKRTCKKSFVDACKATAEKAKDRTCPTSVAGAFLN